MTLEQLLHEIDDLQRVMSRAVLVEVHCPVERRAEVLAHLEGQLGGGAVVVSCGHSRAARQRLTALNSQRDLVLQYAPAIVLVVTSGDETRFVRATAPDLTASLDLVAEVDRPVLARGSIGR